MLDHTVLLVEDDPETLDIMAAVLRGAGYAVVVAAHEEAALAQLAAHAEISVIVTDACFGDGSSRKRAPARFDGADCGDLRQP